MTWAVWHLGHCFFIVIAAPVMSVVVVCSVGGGVCTLVVGTDFFLCMGVIVDVCSCQCGGGVVLSGRQICEAVRSP